MNLKLAAVSRSRRRISLTPLIDVVFILLVFFMLESSFLKIRAIELALPNPGSQPVLQPSRVDLLSSGMVRVDGATVSRAEWLTVLQGRGEPATLSVLLSSEPAVPLQTLVTVMDQLKQAGFARLALTSTEQSQP